MGSADPYGVLGVGRDASPKDIQRAYRRLAKQWHPDVNSDDADAKSKFQEISSAYELLRNDETRARYDRGEIDASGAEKPRYRNAPNGADTNPFASDDWRAAGYAGFDDPDDLFSTIFSRRGGRSFRTRGMDVSYQLEVDFLDAVNGTARRVILPNGTALDVKIPPGTRDGQMLRLLGKGEPGAEGGPPGNALVRVAVRPHPYFVRDGNDIRLDLPISLTEAVLGARIAVPTPTGPVMMTLKPGANTGQTRRLKGKGVPAREGRRGDEYITLKVMLPDTPDPELQSFAEHWQAGKAYNPRRHMHV